MIFSRDKMHFDKMSRLNTVCISGRTNTGIMIMSRLIFRQDNVIKHDFVAADRKQHFRRDKNRTSRDHFRRDNYYTYNPIACRACSPTRTQSRGDLTRGVCFRRACQAPTHDDKKKCPGRNEVRK